MQTIDEITESLRKTLSKIRFDHTLGVAETAKSLAKKWGADSHKAYLAGLVHDCAKEIPKKRQIEFLKEYGYNIDEDRLKSPALLHAPLGSYLARDKFGIDDEEILSAVRYHTTGRPNMALLEKIIYVADFTEPGRSYPEAQIIRELAFKDLDEAALQQTDMVIKFIMDKGSILHRDTILTRDSLLTRGKRYES